MKYRAFVLAALLCSGCEGTARIESKPNVAAPPAPSTISGSAIIETTKEDKPSARLVVDKSARLSLWKRADGACYISVKVDGWKSFYLDASGDVCTSAPDVNAVSLQVEGGK